MLSDHADWPGLQQAIRATGKKAGVALNPGTPAESVRDLIDAEVGLFEEPAGVFDADGRQPLDRRAAELPSEASVQGGRAHGCP